MFNRESEAVAEDRANLANALTDDVEFIAIVESSASAITHPEYRKRLLLLGGITGSTEEEKCADAAKQARLKTNPWETVLGIYRLTRVVT